MLLEELEDIGIDLVVTIRKNGLADNDLLVEGTAENAKLKLLANKLGVRTCNGVPKGRATVFFLNDDVLNGIDETTRELLINYLAALAVWVRRMR